MTNFLTYDNCEAHPGPNLNMVIGPNGTGKSSLIAAIIVGLGGDAKLTGRFKELKELVKKGKERASVEIELKNKARNIVIKREWKKDSNGSKWKLNGEAHDVVELRQPLTFRPPGNPVTEKEIEEKISTLDIQVDNLCQVLPQDRVSEFASLNAQQLLRETQRAAGGPKMVAAHEKLTKLNNEVKDLEKRLAELDRDIEHDETRNRGIEQEVKRVQELEKLQEDLEKVKLKILIKQYDAAFSAHNALKEEVETLKRRKAELDRLNEPLVRKQQKYGDAVKEAKKVVAKSKSDYNETAKGLKKLYDDIERSEDAMKDCRNRLKKAKAAQKECSTKLEDVHKEIGKLERGVVDAVREMEEAGVPANPGEPGTGRYAELQRLIAAKQDEIEAISREAADLDSSATDLRDEVHGYRREQQEANDELRRLADIRNQKLERLRRTDKPTYDAMEVIRNGNLQLEQMPYDPIIVEINPRDLAYASLVENAIAFRFQKTIGCKTKRDFDVLNEELIEKRKLRINLALIEPSDRDEGQPKPVNDRELRDLGFEGWVSDFIDGPEPIKAFLNKHVGLHMPFSRRKFSPEAQTRVENHQTHGRYTFARFFVEDVSYRVNRAYGQFSSNSTFMREAQYLIATADSSRIRELEEKRINAERKLQGAEGRIKEYEKKRGKMTEKHNKLKAEKVLILLLVVCLSDETFQAELVDERKKLDSKRQKVEQFRQKLDLKRSDIDRLQKRIDESQTERTNAAKKLDNLAASRATILTQQEVRLTVVSHSFALKRLCPQRLMQKLVKEDLHNNTLASLDEMKMSARLAAVTEEIAATSHELTEVAAAIEEKSKEVKAAREAAKAVYKDVEAAKERVGHEAFQTLHEAVEAGRNVDRGVIEEYRQRQASLEDKKQNQTQLKTDVENTTERMETIKAAWYPQVIQLVTQINERFGKYFARMKYVGEVHLLEEGSYDQWGIKIMVKFRENEDLQQLSHQRQSGGERAVSTIAYLMAMQTLIKVPFRMVDEINQGMDPRNERLVHAQFVKVSCEEDTAQYFLVTPKLLPDLMYHRNMRVLVVMNGDHLPEREEVDLAKLLQRKRELIGR
ncbi:P-loop containing nucleoside triphosphate hydrolase protein [Hyaloraphidium curvatum]|nr:P-loop containing nucleoside triphosphate hydrolase protein [Hyaloraphidium curvatum]